MIIYINLFLSMIIPLLLGYLCLRAVLGHLRFPMIVSLAISFGLGFGLLSQIMLLCGFFKIDLTVINITAMMAPVVIVCFIQFLKNKRTMNIGRELIKSNNVLVEDAPFEHPMFKACVWLLMAYYFVYMFWSVFNIPVYAWDSIATSVYNAKIIYYDGSLNGFDKLAHKAYPLQLPLMLDWISLHLGQWDDQHIKVLFPLFFISFVILFQYFLQVQVNKQWALLGILFLFSSNMILFHATVSYRDIILMYYGCAVIFFLLLWRDSDSDALLVLSSLFAGFATFVKLEGVAYLPIYGAVLLWLLLYRKNHSYMNKFLSLVKFILAPGLMYLLFLIFKKMNGGLASEYVELRFFVSWPALKDALYGFGEAVFLNANWNIIWTFLIISLIYKFRNLRYSTSLQVCLMVVVMFFSLHFSLSVFSAQGDHIVSAFTLPRLIIHFFPLAICSIIFLYSHKSA